MGVEWVCELKHHFPRLKVAMCDFLPRCLGPLPDEAAAYCQAFMESHNIKTVYQTKYDDRSKQSSEFWRKVDMPRGADRTYVLSGVRHSNHYMPENTRNTK